MTTETRIFSANLENYSSRLNVSFEKAIAEAVVNSLQANAHNIEVNIKTFQDGNIECVEVIDDGEGFTDFNINSFFDLHSDYKKNIGGKGVGRATWFKFFSVVSVDSIFKSNNKYEHVSFVFKKDDRKVDIDKTITENSVVKTSVKMSVYIARQMLQNLQSTLKQYLLKEMALMLYRLECPFMISLNFIENDTSRANQTIDKSDLPINIKKYDFDVKIEKENQKFSLHCIHFETTTGNRVETGFVAGNRTLSNFETALGLKIKSPTTQYSGQYWLLLESQLLTDGRFTSDDRETVVFPEGKDLWGNDVRSEIRGKLASAISTYFDHVAPEHIEQRQAVINEIYDLYPQYAHPQYQDTINEVVIDTIGRIDKHSLLKKLSEIDFSREYHFKNELVDLMKSKKINEKTIDEIAESAEKTSEQAKSILSNYFWYRMAVIKQLEVFINDNEKSETLLHELFYKRFSTTENIDLQNCIWLLDDKFMRFAYFASEGIVKNVIDDIYGEHDDDHNSKKVMDLFIAFDRDLEGMDCTKDCVIIEFKGLGVNRDQKANAASQVRRKYAQSIRKHAPNIGRVFIFIITYIDDETKEDLKSDDFREAVTRYGTMMNYYNKENDAHICFLCASTVIGDAKDRHELFFKLLREELSQKQRLGMQSSISSD